MKYYTDYPIVALGDIPRVLSPIREVRIIRYDGDKYCLIQVEGVKQTIKTGYIYTKYGRFGEVPSVSCKHLMYYEN